LRDAIQKAADEREVGVRILLVGLQDLHPPVKVAPDYEKVVGALHEKRAKILAARAAQVKTNAQAEAQATNAITSLPPTACEQKSAPSRARGCSPTSCRHFRRRPRCMLCGSISKPLSDQPLGRASMYC